MAIRTVIYRDAKLEEIVIQRVDTETLDENNEALPVEGYPIVRISLADLVGLLTEDDLTAMGGDLVFKARWLRFKDTDSCVAMKQAVLATVAIPDV